jgi:O-antigen/teichoic acid export membrane protein
MTIRSKLKRRTDSFAGRSIASLAVKVFGALASYLFFMAFAYQLSAVQFGIFAFAFSAANFGMLAAGLGQPMLMLRNLSYAMAEKNEPSARAILRFGLRGTALGIVLGSICLGIFLIVAPNFGAPYAPGLALAAMALLGVLVIAEFLAHLLRVFGMVAMAIAPKDLFWRVLAIAAVAVMAAAGLSADATGALWVATGTLLGLIIWQGFTACKIVPAAIRRGTADVRDADDLRRSSFHFWGIAVASGLSQHLTVVAVGFAADPDQIGAFFAAFRTASLLSMPLTAANIVLAPMIARHYREGRRDEIQKLIREFISLASVPTVIGLVIFAIWGEGILGLFDPSYRASFGVLMIFSIGFLVNTLTGPCGYLMMMAGAEDKFLRYSLLANIAAVLGATVLSFFDLTWVALLMVVANIAQNLLAVRWGRRVLAIETTLACLWKRTPG